MSETITLNPLKTLFKFPFQGPDWRNRFIIGVALTFAGFVVPIVPGIFVFGYLLHIMRQVIEGQDNLELPAWDNWGKLGADGLRLLVVSLAYLLPGLLIMFIGFAAYFGMIFSLPFMEGENEGTFMLLMFGSMGVMMLSMTLGMLLLILGFIPLPAATAHFAAKDELSAAFKVRQWQSLIKVNKLGYFAAWVVVLGLAMVLYQLFIVIYSTIILCWILPLFIAPIGFYIQVIGAAVFAQTYRESKAIAAEAQSALPEDAEPENSAEDNSGESSESQS